MRTAIFLLLMDYIGEYDEQRVKFLQCQDVEDEHGRQLWSYPGRTWQLMQERILNESQIDASELIIGMKCGGSDGLSGITANPD